MGVYIKGMEMTGRCGYCPCFHAEHPIHCQAVKADKAKRIAAPYGLPRPDWCPLDEVTTPHGRLIDADALIEDLERQCKEVFRIDAVSPDDYWITRNEAYNEALWKSWVESFGEYLKTRPTIIEAEE